jgi:hypothetical protein
MRLIGGATGINFDSLSMTGNGTGDVAIHFSPNYYIDSAISNIQGVSACHFEGPWTETFATHILADHGVGISYDGWRASAGGERPMKVTTSNASYRCSKCRCYGAPTGNIIIEDTGRSFNLMVDAADAQGDYNFDQPYGIPKGTLHKTGSGTPEGNVTAAPGSTFHRTDGGANQGIYIKESGTGNTGWVAK